MLIIALIKIKKGRGNLLKSLLPFSFIILYYSFSDHQKGKSLLSLPPKFGLELNGAAC